MSKLKRRRPPLCVCGCGQPVKRNQNHKGWNKFIFGHENNLRKQKARDSFISRSKKIFPQYDFSKFNYINTHTKSIVICPSHGQFKVTALNILRGHGCPGCKADKAIKLAKKSFFRNTIKNFPNYDFSEFEYIKSHIKSKVICKKHGPFLMSPGSLKAGKGCPICGIEKCAGWNRVAMYQKASIGRDFAIFYKLLFIHKLSKVRFVKIGITSRTLDRRYMDKVYKNFDYAVIDMWHGTNLECAIKEREYKRKNKAKRFYLPDTIEFPGRSECYEYDKDQQLTMAGIKFIREALLIKQNGVCPICKKEITKPVLDHQHIRKIKGTGRCRGVLCATCNIFLGKIENNCVRFGISQKDLPNVLRAIATFLEAEQSKYLHPEAHSHPKKLGKREYNKIIKHYFQMYPKRKKLPVFPKSGRVTKEFVLLLEKIQQKYEKPLVRRKFTRMKSEL